jgi:2-polyprenyl-6-methoxyphenol hydroxylase-like FAD-dependent oxidoreductase
MDGGVWLGQIGDRGYLATPTDGDLFLAAVVEPLDRLERMRSEREQLHAEGIEAWPELADRLAGAERVGPLRAMGRWQGFFREATGPGWALIGDAGHFKDPTPGQGIADALRQAETMAPAIAAAWGDERALDATLRDWWAWRDRDAWEMYWFAQDMGSQELAPLLLDEFGARLAEDPELAEGFLRVLNHEILPSKFFTARVMAPIVARAFSSGRGRRRALARELGNLAVNEFRHRRPLRFPVKPRLSAG